MFGVAASPGVALGQCMVIQSVEHGDYKTEKIETDAVDRALERIETATAKVKQQLNIIKEKAISEGRQENANVMDAHMMILMDPMFTDGFKQAVQNMNMSAEGAVQKTVEDQAAIFDAMDDAYLKERAHDIRDIGSRILNALVGVDVPDVSQLQAPTILVAEDIPPSMMASVDRDNLLGIVTEIGGKTSHTAILASNMGIPAVMGCTGAVEHILKDEPGAVSCVDGTRGVFQLNLNDAAIEALQSKIDTERAVKASLHALKDSETKTKDNVKIQLAANIMNPNEIEDILGVGAEGIGLYRTEFLFMDRQSLPSEDEQYEAYKKVLEGMAGKPVIIRTMDIGGDKEVDYLNLEKEQNPFLGYRALRICLDRPELFHTQLRAILRASVHGKALIMFPMVSAVEEIRNAKAQVDTVKAALRKDNILFDENIQIGIMIEIPSAALIADMLIDEVDFFSIGSNDLTQYTVAVDRMNERIGNLYNSYHPAMLRLIKSVVDAARGAGGHKFAGMCGEMAGDPKATLLLVGLGLQEFSVSPAKLLRVRKLISGIDNQHAEAVAQKALKLSSASEIEALLESALPDELKMYVS